MAIRYTQEQKDNALAMMAEKGAKATSEELNISVNTLYQWRRAAQAADEGAQSPEGIVEAGATDEIERLLAEDNAAKDERIRALEEENAALKAAIARLEERNRKFRAAIEALIK